MMITAHSGCDGTGMNTKEYLLHAASLPIDALEIDVRRRADGLVLTHDSVGDRPLVTLDEAFEFLAGKTIKINCDLKEYGLEDELLSCARKHGVEDRLILTGSVTDCISFRESHPNVEVFINAEELVPGFYENINTELLIERCKQSGYGVINIDYQVCNEEFIERCREEGILLSVWTVDDPEEQREFSLVYNLTTNKTMSAVKVVMDRR